MGMVRRAVVAWCVVGCAGAGSGCGSCCRNATSSSPLAVGVVGAGFAGLGAASRLAARGCEVSVLEARSRVGGRAETRSVSGDGSGVDMGPMWLHGVDRHPLLPYARRYGMTLAASDYDSAVAYNGSASARRPRLGMETLEEWYEAWEDVVYPVVERMQDDTDSDESLASAVARVVAGLGARAGALAKEAILTFVTTENVVLDTAADLEDLSLWWWDADRWLDDEVQDSRDSVLRPGYGVLAERIAADANATFFLNAAVTEVVADGARCRVATEEDEVFSFDRVVVALPLGVLQARAVAFDPPLDEAALLGRGAGVAEKYVLYFTNVFWEDVDFLFTVEPDPLEWLNLDRALGQPALACFTAGSLALEIAELSDVDKEAFLVAALERMYPTANVTVVASAFSSWHDDDRTLGGWSFVRPGTDYPSNHAALRAPILRGAGALAGEYASDYYGTVHGAWFSGVDAADLVLDGPDDDDDDDDDDDGIFDDPVPWAVASGVLACAVAAASAYFLRKRASEAAGAPPQDADDAVEIQSLAAGAV